MRTAIIIPARYGSTRFPGKPLALLKGKPILQHVVDLCTKATEGLDNVSVHVATDDQRIADFANSIGVSAIMTDESCKTGSDRARAAADTLPEKPDFILNVQGDAPLTPPEVVRQLVLSAQAGEVKDIVTPAVQLGWDDLDIFRERKHETPFSGTTVVFDAKKRAMWFSKQVLPAIRGEDKLRSSEVLSPVFRHIGLYGYMSHALEAFCEMPETQYEKLEGLEQLRALEAGLHIRVVPVKVNLAFLSGIDTQADLANAERYL